MKAFLRISVPFISSEPIFNNDTFGFSFGNKDLYKAEPNSAKSTKLSSSHSILAPKSNTTFVFLLFGHKPARAGLLTSSIILSIILETTNNTPVLPADRLISESPLTCELIQFHILVFLEFFIAVKGVSSSATTESVCVIFKLVLSIFSFFNFSSILFLSPNKLIIKSSCD